MNDKPDFATATKAQQATWAEGDFSVVAGIVNRDADNLAEALEIVPGERVLDVACGSGNGAIAAARRAWGNTVGADFVPALLERARERAAAERLEIEFVEADAQELPFEDAGFDVTMSIFGVMFAPDQEQAAAELLRVTKPGGRIGLASWCPDGGLEKLFMTVAKHTGGPPPGVAPPVLWGMEEHLRGLFGEGIGELRASRQKSRQPFLLGRPVHRLLPHLLRPDQDRLRESRRGGRGGADRGPARDAGRGEHRRRAGARSGAGIPAGGGHPRRVAAPISFRCSFAGLFRGKEQRKPRGALGPIPIGKSHPWIRFRTGADSAPSRIPRGAATRNPRRDRPAWS